MLELIRALPVMAVALQAVCQTASAQAASSAVDSFLTVAEDADVVILGEIHDNPEHHRTQADIVAALAPAALVFEMIAQEDEATVNALRAQGAARDAIAAALEWETSGWPSFSYYAEIMEAAPEARIFGAGQPPADVRRAMLEGAAGAFGPDAALYGLDQPLEPDEQAAREAIQADAHCGALSSDLLPGMVEAQLFRDAGLADATLWARLTTDEGQVVVIAGSGHADKLRGMPALIAVAEPEATVAALGQFEQSAGEDAAAFDTVVLAPAPAREDPCKAFSAPSD